MIRPGAPMDPSNLSCAHHSIDFVTDIDSVEEKVARTDRVTLHSDAAVKSNVIPLLPPGLDLTASGLKAQIALVDGLVEQVAILDRNWTLLALNRAWTKATMAGASPELRLGLN